MYAFFKDDGFDFMMTIALGATYYRAADVGECLATATHIRNGDYNSWVRAWTATGARVQAIADACAAGGRHVSAREAYLRASTYFGVATYFVDGTRDPSQMTPLWERHRASWDAAAALFDPPVEMLAIPYEGTTLEGYFFRVDDSGAARPLVILNNGSDGTVTDMWVQGAAAALERGYNAMTFDGPGQGAALFRQQLYFRPDWERVITPVVDFLVQRPDVDAQRMALLGVSQAGYWVPRALAFEHRIAAGVADPGVVDVSTSWDSHLPRQMHKLLDAGNQRSFDRWMGWGERFSKQARYITKFRMRPYGSDSPFETYRQLERYNLSEVAKNIQCPLLITDPADEQFWPGQSRELFDLLTCPKELLTFTAEEGASSHCEPGAAGLRDQRIFDWLDTTLAVG